ncbi:MAG: prepilin-type N-terminal cleavage/methylation domain-containing protein [bacterium]
MRVSRGFTLVELLVTITIFVVLTGVVLFSQNKFNGSIMLTNLAYDTALTLRQAQTYGVNVREFNGNFMPYGVHFDKTNLKSFILFTDLNSSGVFDGDPTVCLDQPNGTDDGCVQKFNIKSNNLIGSICSSVTDNNTCDYQSADVTFKRPNPEANIRLTKNASTAIFDNVRIILSSPTNETREVIVQKNGLIYVKQR